MKKLAGLLCSIVITMLFAFDKPSKEEIYKVDIQLSSVRWTAKKVTGGHDGDLKLSQGLLVYNGKSLVKGSFLMDMNSITSDNAKVTAHLKTDDFFSVAQNPTSKFEITKVTSAGAGRVNITGYLTIKGITHPITFPATIKQEKDVVVAAASGVKVNRTKYDIKYRSSSFFGDIGNKAINDDFILEINLVAKK